MFYQPTPEEQLHVLEKQLADIYKKISAHYKLMTKVKDELRLSAMQNGADQFAAQALEVREQMMVLRRKILDEWNSRERTHAKTCYDC